MNSRHEVSGRHPSQMTVRELREKVDSGARFSLSLMLALLIICCIPGVGRLGSVGNVIIVTILIGSMISAAAFIALGSALSPARIADLKVTELPTTKGVKGYWASLADYLTKWREEEDRRIIRRLATWFASVTFIYCAVASVDQAQNVILDGHVIPRELASLNTIPMMLGFLTGVLLIVGVGALLAALLTMRSPSWIVARVATDVGAWTAVGFIIGFAQFLYAVHSHPGRGQVHAVGNLLDYSLAGALLGILIGLVNSVGEAVGSSLEEIPRRFYRYFRWRRRRTAFGVSLVVILTAAGTGAFLPRAWLVTGISTAIYDDYAQDAFPKALEFEKELGLEKGVRSEAAGGGATLEPDVVDRIALRIKEDIATGRGKVQGNEEVNGQAFWLALGLLLIGCARGVVAAGENGRQVASHDAGRDRGEAPNSPSTPA